MNIKGFRRMLLGEKMPDRNDPKYKERYEREVNAGRRFAKATRIDKAAAKVQGFANVHRTLFLVIVFAFVAAGLAWNIYRLTVVYHRQPVKRTAPRCRTASCGKGTGHPSCMYNHQKNNDDEHIGENQFQATEVHASGHPLPAAARRVVLHLRPVPHRKKPKCRTPRCRPPSS